MKNPNDAVTFRIRSWALVPGDASQWSPWNHCSRKTMMNFLNALKSIDEYSNAHLSPDYETKYGALLEAQVIANDGESWNWTPDGGWARMPQDPTLADVPTGKGKRPTKKTREQLAADRAAADDEIFGTAITMDEIEDPNNPDR